MDRYNTQLKLRQDEMEARRLRAEYEGDLLMRTVIALDIAIRRAACRIASSFDGT